MNKKLLKVISIGAILGSMMQIGMPLSAEAAIDSYIIKISKEIYSYNKIELVDDFLQYKLGNKAELYSDFSIKLRMSNGFYAFHNKKRGYIKYEDIENNYLKSKESNTKFNVEKYTESKESKIIEVNWTKKAIVTVEGNVKYITPESITDSIKENQNQNVLEDKDNSSVKDNNIEKIDENNEKSSILAEENGSHKYTATKRHKKKYNSRNREKENQAKVQKEEEARELKLQEKARAREEQNKKEEAEKLKQQQEVEKQEKLKKEQEEKDRLAKIETERQAQLKKEKEAREAKEREEALKRQQEQEKQRIKDENNRLIEEAKNNLNLGDLANVKANLILSTEDSNGVKISWKSNDEATIKSDGTVTRPSADSEDKNVKLVATFTKGEEVSTKEFESIVKAQEKPKVKTEEEIVELLKEDKPIEFKKPENFDIAIKESLNQLKPSFEAVVPYSEYNKYNFNNYNNIMVQLGGNDYGKPGVQTSGGTVIDGKVKMTVKFNYRRDIDEVKRQKKATEEVVKKIVKEVIKPGMSDVEKELALHDYVVKHADYNMAGLNKNPADLEDHSAYGVLVLGKGVCESYAKAMHLLLNEVGIECKYATGYKRNPNGGKGGGHAWNMVKLDNEWYNLDATWDDPVSDRVGRSDNEAIVSPVIHTYFNVPDSVFNKDHIRGDFEQNNYPVANGTKYSYDNLDVDEFMNDGTKVPKVTSRDELIRVFKEVMKNRKTEVYVRFKGFSMTQQDLMNMLGKILDGNIYSSYGVNPTDSSHAYCVFKLR